MTAKQVENWHNLDIDLICKFLENSPVVPTVSRVARLIAKLDRIDFIKDLPTELGLRILSFLDARSITECAKVSKSWRTVADDDRLWYRMCQQHIDRKCESCGWGLPVLHHHAHLLRGHASSCCSKKRPRDGPDYTDRLSSDQPPYVKSGWKHVFAERLIVERNWRKAKFKQRTLEGHSDCIHRIKVNLDYPKFPLLATGSYDHTVKLWNLDTGECIHTLAEHTGWIWDLQLDNHKLVSASGDMSLKIWDLNTGKCVRTLQGHRDHVTCVDFAGNLLVSGSADWSIRAWDTAAGRASLLSGHTDWVNSVKILPNTLPKGWQRPADSQFTGQHRFAISGSDDCTVRLWDLDDKTCLVVLNSHLKPVFSLSCRYLPLATFEATDGTSSAETSSSLAQLVAMSSSGDNTIKVWNLETGKCVRTFFGHVDAVWDVQFDSLRIASASQDGHVKVWDFNGQCLETFPLKSESALEPILALSLSDTMLVFGGNNAKIQIYDFNSIC